MKICKRLRIRIAQRVAETPFDRFLEQNFFDALQRGSDRGQLRRDRFERPVFFDHFFNRRQMPVRSRQSPRQRSASFVQLVKIVIFVQLVSLLRLYSRRRRDNRAASFDRNKIRVRFRQTTRYITITQSLKKARAGRDSSTSPGRRRLEFHEKNDFTARRFAAALFRSSPPFLAAVPSIFASFFLRFFRDRGARFFRFRKTL